MSESADSRQLTHAVVFWGRRGGGPLFAAGVAHDMVVNDAGGRVVCSLAQDNDALDFFPEHVERHVVDGVPAGGGLLSALARIRQFRAAFRRFLDEVQPDTLVFPMIFFALPFMVDIAVRRKISMTYFVHDFSPHPGDRGSFFLMALQKLILSKFNKIIFLSEYVKLKYSEYVSHNRSRSSTVGVHTLDRYFSYVAECYAQHCAQQKVTRSQKCCTALMRSKADDSSAYDDTKVVKFLYIGRVCRYKGLDVLLDALADIDWPALKGRMRFCLLGQGPDSERIASQLQRLPPEAQVSAVFAWQSHHEVFGAIEAHDVIVLPYVEASQSGVLAIAKLLNKRVIVSDVGALSEQVAGYNRARLVAAGDVGALKAALLECSNSRHVH